MPDPILAAEPPPLPEALLSSADLAFDVFSSEFDNFPIPTMDALFAHADGVDALLSDVFASDLDFPREFGDGGDYEITFDDLDSLCIPSDPEDFLLPDACNPDGGSISRLIDDRGDSSCKNYDSEAVHSDSPKSGSSPVSGDCSSGVSRFLNSSEFGSCKRELSPQDPHNSDSCGEREESSNGGISSHSSGNGGSCVYETMKSSSPDSDRYQREISSSHKHAIIDQNVKFQDNAKGCDLKRKKEQSEGSAETRTTKYRRPSTSVENKTEQSSGLICGDDEDDKKKARLMRNRESAQLSRQRKKHYVEELEGKLRSMHSTITDLSGKISFLMAENATLRQQFGVGGMCPPPLAHGMYPPMAPMPYPWMPCSPFVKPQGSQVPVVPIPRLKSQEPASSSKSKKSEGKKSAEVKTKKVASISLLGLFFFIMLFGGLVPLVDVKFGDLIRYVPGRSSYVSDRLYVHGGGGRVWPVNGHRNGSERDGEVGYSNNGRFSISERREYERGRKLGEETHVRHDLQCDEFGHRGNASEPLMASLYVPRNDKLVKIDGNLIIHSILASEKGMASHTDKAKEDKRETGLAIPKDLDSALAIPEVGRNIGENPNVYRVPPKQRKALGSGSAKTLKDHMKSSATDGKMQQWFREGLAGPMLSSGMCTEVFQFDVSPKTGAIVPATSVANISRENHQNGTTLNKSRNRRILHELPDHPFTGSSLNLTEELARNPQNDHLHGNKSSMVVSVLVDPKEAADGDVDGMMTPKSISRIFVVVLMDSVKYATYSCGLPRLSPHLVTA